MTPEPALLVPSLRKRGGVRCKRLLSRIRIRLGCQSRISWQGQRCKGDQARASILEGTAPRCEASTSRSSRAPPRTPSQSYLLSSAQVGHTGWGERSVGAKKTSDASMSRRQDSRWTQWACRILDKNFGVRRSEPESCLHRHQLCVQAHVSVLRTWVLDPKQRS